MYSYFTKGRVFLVGRNDPCPCGSGKKYKKCCESNKDFSVKEAQSSELEMILQAFYEEYPEKKDLNQFLSLVKKWSEPLQQYIAVEMIEAIVMDEFFFHQKPDIWESYLGKLQKKVIRPSVLKVLETWSNPRAFIGQVVNVDEHYLSVKNIFGLETIRLRRESEKPVPMDVHVYCFILPDESSIDNHYLAISSLIFFPTDHDKVFDEFVQLFEMHEQSISSFLKENGISFWKLLGEDGYDGSEFTDFEVGVIQVVLEFLDNNERESEMLLDLLEDYLVEQQPNARKEVAIAAGAIRFGQENSFFEPLDMNIKQIAEWFKVSTSSLNKYYNELNDYYQSNK